LEAAQQQTVSASQTSLVAGGQSQVSTLTHEVESLKVVIDLRNEEISQLKQSKADLQKQVTC